MMNEITINKLKSFLNGSTCVEMENFGDYLQLSFGSFKLIVSSAWRLVYKKEIVVGSTSDDITLAKIPDILLKRTIQEITVNGDFNDLTLIFDKEIILETFGNSEKYEHWNVLVNTGEMIISGPSRLWSAF